MSDLAANLTATLIMAGVALIIICLIRRSK